MKKVVVIGAGASGLIASIYAAKNGNRVTLLERNSSPAKKILITGNGRCNYFNEDQGLNHYHSSDNKYLEKIINEKNINDVLSFFDNMGIVPKIKNGYYYPYSNQATSIRSALILEAQLSGVEIVTEAFVSEIKKDNIFKVKLGKEEINADVVIVATGGMAAPKTGSDGNGYDLVKSLGHTIVKPRPALVQLRGNENYFKEWDGIRCDASITLYEEHKALKTEKGELQLTDYGISGICVFNLSGLAAHSLSQNKKTYVKINFVPFINVKTIKELISFIDKRNEIVKDRNIEQLFEGMLNYKLINVLLKKSQVAKEKKWDDLSFEKKEILANNMMNFHLDIIDTNSFDKAQVCSGGVPLNEINPETMESLKVKDLYLTGELLDIYGDCGGYNLSFAWISGMLSGRGIK